MLISWFVIFRYLCILFSFALNSLLICPMTSFKSLFSSTILASRPSRPLALSTWLRIQPHYWSQGIGAGLHTSGVSLGSNDDDACSSSFMSMICPLDCLFLVFSIFRHSKLCYEVYQCLGFYGHPRFVLDVELTKLDGPLYHSSYGFEFIHFLLGGLVCHYYDRVCLKVWTKFPRGHYHGKCDLLHMWVFGFSPLEGLADIIH